MNMILSIFVLFSLVSGGIQLSLYDDYSYHEQYDDLSDFWLNISDSVEQQNTWNRVWNKLTSVACWCWGYDSMYWLGRVEYDFNANKSWSCEHLWGCCSGFVEDFIIGKYIGIKSGVEYDGIIVASPYDDGLEEIYGDLPDFFWEAFIVGTGDHEDQVLNIKDFFEEGTRGLNPKYLMLDGCCSGGSEIC